MRLLIALIFTSIIAKSQDIDTILPHILSMPSDSQKVNYLYRYSGAFIKINPQVAYEFAKIGEDLSIRIHNKNRLSEFYNLFGILYYKKGDFKKAIHYYQLSYSLSKEINNALSMAYCMTNLANIYSDLKQYKRSEDAYLQSLGIYNELGDNENLAKCLINLGILKQTLLQYDAAFESYKKAREIGKRMNDYHIESLCLNNMAQVFADKGNFEQALAYNNDALKVRDLMDNEEEKADTYLSLTEIYIKQKKTADAEENLKAANEICDKYEYFSGKLLALKLLSQINELKGDFKQAYENLRKFNQVNDSLVVVENSSGDSFTFDENLSADLSSPKDHKGLNNQAMLMAIIIFIIFIPFILIRYKR